MSAFPVIPTRVVSVKPLRKSATLPTYGTELAACADIYACLEVGDLVTYYFDHAEHGTVMEKRAVEGSAAYPESQYLLILPHERVLVPTGLALGIPDGYSVRTHPRSGISVKKGLVVVCGEGVIDEDYQLELFVPLINLSAVPQYIKPGERIAQMELVRDERAQFKFVEELPTKISSRAGGFGHTGSA